MKGDDGRVTEAELKSYRALCKKIADLNRRIEKEQDKPVEIDAGKVRASMTEFPYTEIHVGVEMEEPAAADARDKLIRLYRQARDQAEQKKLEIEKFIEGIPDPELQLIFRYRYIDGKKLFDIGNELGMDRSWLGRKIHKYLETKSPQNPF